MKNYFKFPLLVVALCVTIGANAQFGVKAGYVLSHSTTKVKQTGINSSPKDLNGFYVGANYDLALGSFGLSLRPGLNYTYLGGKLANVGSIELPKPDGLPDDFGNMKVDVNQREHFLTIPVDVKYAYAFGRGFKVYGFAGPSFIVGLSSTINTHVPAVQSIIPAMDVSYNLYTGKVKASAAGKDSSCDSEKQVAVYNRFDLGLGLGAGFQWKALSLELGYDWGLLNRLKNEGAKQAYTRRSQFVLGVGYSF